MHEGLMEQRLVTKAYLIVLCILQADATLSSGFWPYTTCMDNLDSACMSKRVAVKSGTNHSISYWSLLAGTEE